MSSRTDREKKKFTLANNEVAIRVILVEGNGRNSGPSQNLSTSEYNKFTESDDQFQVVRMIGA